MSSAQLAADAQATKDVLLTHGWTQGSYGRADGSHCLVGAGRTALYGSVLPRLDDFDEDERDALYARGLALTHALQRAVGCLYIPDWNDLKGRRLTEVTAVLDKIIADNTPDSDVPVVAKADLELAGGPTA